MEIGLKEDLIRSVKQLPHHLTSSKKTVTTVVETPFKIFNKGADTLGGIAKGGFDMVGGIVKSPIMLIGGAVVAIGVVMFLSKKDKR